VPFRVGIDVGGTFTDAVAIDSAGGEKRWAKVPTTPPGFIEGVVESVRALDVDLSSVSEMAVHATTIGINAVVEGKFPPTGLICTQGFRDFLEIRRTRRPDLYNPWWNKPEPLVPRHHRIGARERIGADGEVVEPLHEADVRDAVRFLRTEGVESYAVCTLFSFKNPVHEERIRDIILEEHPDAFIALSSEVAPIIREYERTSTTTINAVLMPIMSAYIDRLVAALQGIGVEAPLLLMRSNGGVVPLQTARIKPVELLEGGHAAGAALSAWVGSQIGSSNIIAYDGGGTTATITLVEGGAPVTESQLDLMFEVFAATPTVAVRSIGQGGGAIAWIDTGGALRVGPQSAGAFPGPVVYGQGGTQPTITDALVVLGILDPERDWIRGTLWARGAAEQALEEQIGRRFGWGAPEAAYAIYQVGLTNVANLLREEITAKGRDPRDFSLLAIGGSGPMLAAELAAEHEISQVVVPESLGTASALGCLVSDLVYDYVQSHLSLLDELGIDELDSLLTTLSERADADLRRDELQASSSAGFAFALDLRYAGEHFELTVPLPRSGDTVDIQAAVTRFHQDHERLYGFWRPDEPLELVSVRLQVRLPIERRFVWEHAAPQPNGAVHPASQRPVLFDIERGYVMTDIYDGERLKPGATMHGPAIVHRLDGTVPIPPHWQGEIDIHGHLVLTRA
jgi:N-methylhydantoinase A/oxoprolinase/acetone carboxylase beta subunit